MFTQQSGDNAAHFWDNLSSKAAGVTFSSFSYRHCRYQVHHPPVNPPIATALRGQSLYEIECGVPTRKQRSSQWVLYGMKTDVFSTKASVKLKHAHMTHLLLDYSQKCLFLVTNRIPYSMSDQFVVQNNNATELLLSMCVSVWYPPLLFPSLLIVLHSLKHYTQTVLFHCLLRHTEPLSNVEQRSYTSAWAGLWSVLVHSKDTASTVQKQQEGEQGF